MIGRKLKNLITKRKRGSKMARPRSLKTVDYSEIPEPGDAEEVLKGVVKGTGKIPSVGICRAGQEIYLIVKKVEE